MFAFLSETIVREPTRQATDTHGRPRERRYLMMDQVRGISAPGSAAPKRTLSPLQEHDTQDIGLRLALSRPPCTLVDPLEDDVRDLQVVFVLHQHVAAAPNTSLGRRDDFCLPAGRPDARGIGAATV